jgi:uncharacterized protein YceH (UPF0502 family)
MRCGRSWKWWTLWTRLENAESRNRGFRDTTRRSRTMSDLQGTLDSKKRELQELIRSRSKATCSDVVSTEIDVRRETRIEELEEEIQQLKARLEQPESR